MLTTVSPRDVISLMGPEPRYLVPWMLLAIKTGQALRIPKEKVNKELMGRIIKGLISRTNRRNPPRLTNPQRAIVSGMGQGVPPARVLLQMLKLAGMANEPGKPGEAGALVQTLADRFEGRLDDFLKQPSDEAFTELRESLTPEEKSVLAILQRVARSQ